MTLRDHLALVPVPARILAALPPLVVTGLCFSFFDGHHIPGLGTAMGLLLGTILGIFVLLAGYVYGDASRRGMHPIAWTALALLIPNGVGFVLYFLLRKPILRPCPACGSGIAPEAAFCPRCGQPQPSLGLQPS
ncbi:MAG TPA: zinc ribbon domain-containing protein [Bryobacteraceae bacterium]|jgi:hypothetical protein